MFNRIPSRPILALLLNLAIGGAFLPSWVVAAAPEAPKSARNSADQAESKPAKARFEILLAAGLYTRWPAGVFEGREDSGVTVGIVGNDPNIDQLRLLAGERKIGGRKVAVRCFTTLSEVETCQMLLLADSISKNDRLALIEKYRNAPVLLASSVPGFCQEGGGLGFLTDGDNVKFTLNLQTLARQKLVVDPRYSRLAQPAGVPEQKPNLIAPQSGGHRR